MPDPSPPFTGSLIYFMSGTGNSYRLAVWMREACRSIGMDSRVIPIDRARPREEIAAAPDTLVILAYPTHGFLPPWSMIKFIFKLPVRRGARIFWAPTRGSFYLGRVLVPGAAGPASFLPALILPLKGYRPLGMSSFDMPANMISIHSRLSDRNIERIKRKAARKLQRIFPRVLKGKGRWWTLNNLYELVWTIPLLGFFPLFPLLYLLYGRLFMGKLMFAGGDCIGCGLCARSCPNHAIVMRGRRRPRPYWRHNCEDCLRCMNYCPQQAIEVGHSWGVILYLISLYPFSVTLFDLAARLWPPLEAARSWSAVTLFNAAWYYPVILLAYFLFSILIRWKPIALFFAWTTFTRLFRRYHEPETGLSDLIGETPGKAAQG